MTEEEKDPVSEGPEQQQEVKEEEQEQKAEVEQQEERQVPLSALEAERKKRQETEAENRLYQQYIQNAQQQTQQPQKEEEDADDLISKRDALKLVNQHLTQTKQEVLEESFCSSNPDAVRQIEEQLPNIIKAKPWIKDVVENAPNRWQMAYELVKDYAPKQEPVSQQKKQEAQRIIENSQKPGSPSGGGKSAPRSKVDYMRSIRGTPEWDEYRARVMRGET